MSAEDGTPAPAKRVGVWIARGCAVWVGLAMATALVAMLLPGMPWCFYRPRPEKRLVCLNNLAQLAMLYDEVSADPSWRPRSGPSLVLAWRKDGRKIKRGQEHVLVCPGDPGAAVPDTPEAVDRYDAVDLDDPPDDLCSYAVRDFDRFPPDPERLGEEPFAACVGSFHGGAWSACHKGGIVLAYCDGHTLFLRWDELGFAPDAAPPDKPPVVGPDSTSPLLRVLCFRPGVTTRAAR